MIAYFNLFLWLTEVKIYPIMLVQNVMRCIDVLSPDYLTDIIIDVVAALLQLGLRLYLKFVKKNNSSNELLSIKFILILIFVSISYFFPLPESSQSFVPPFAIILAMTLTTIIFDHSGFNRYFMEDHPSFRDFTSAIWHLIIKLYRKAKAFFLITWNYVKAIFLNMWGPNQIQPHEVPE